MREPFDMAGDQRPQTLIVKYTEDRLVVVGRQVHKVDIQERDRAAVH